MAKADVLYLGRIITMADNKQRAEALTVKDGLIQYVGSADIAHSLCDDNTTVVDLGESVIYPGFMEAHAHPYGAGERLDVDHFAPLGEGKSMPEYVDMMNAFIQKHPGQEIYKGAGFLERECLPTAAMLDAICPDVPVVITGKDGHSSWLNTKAMEHFGVTRETAKTFGPAYVPVDDQGNPTGYLAEVPSMMVMKTVPTTDEEAGSYLTKTQEFFFKKGYTAVYEAGLEVANPHVLDFYRSYDAKGHLKLRVYAGSLVDEFCEDIPAAVERIAQMRQECSSEHLKVIGVKTFADGVVEASTAYMLDDYSNDPGNKGKSRMVDHDKLVQLYSAATQHNMSVHVHAIGDAATRCHLDAIEETIALTGKTDQRFALAHLECVAAKDIPRFADLNVMPVVAPLWAPISMDYRASELEHLGEKRAAAAYPIRSFADAGCAVTFHTDYPVSPRVDIAESIFTAVTGRFPDDGEETIRDAGQTLTRYQAVAAMTKNVAYIWHEEDRLGTLEPGKIANMTVFDCDFLEDSLERIGNAKLVCTIVDGQIVYQAAE